MKDYNYNGLWDYLACSQGKKPVVLYGMGNGADKVLNICRKRGIAVSGVFASDGFARHNQYQGYTVMSYGEAKQQFGDMTVLVCFGTQRPEVMALIRQVAEEQELYVPDVPVIGEGLFTPEYVQLHRSELELVYRALEDEESRRVFDCLVAYRLTGDIRHLLRAESDPAEAWSNILKPSKEERFLDLGAYTGDTVAEFIRHAGGYASVTAVEPDEKTYRKLTANVPFARCIHAAAADRPGTVPFSAKGGRQSAVSSGDRTVPAISIDSLQTPFTMIKMDIEGAEAAAVFGGAETIKAYRPKLQIAAYHRTEDYFSLPLQILELQPDYNVYLRHFPYIPAWDTNFYFV